eukprot:171850-Chlamydomonas_euryale.AAC.4
MCVRRAVASPPLRRRGVQRPSATCHIASSHKANIPPSCQHPLRPARLGRTPYPRSASLPRAAACVRSERASEREPPGVPAPPRPASLAGASGGERTAVAAAVVGLTQRASIRCSGSAPRRGAVLSSTGGLVLSLQPVRRRGKVPPRRRCVQQRCGRSWRQRREARRP